MDKLLALLLFITAAGVAVFAFPHGPAAVLFGSVCAVTALLLIHNNSSGEERVFFKRIFVIGLLLRVIVAVVTHVFELQAFFGGDSITYDLSGDALYNSWFGSFKDVNQVYLDYVIRAKGSGWGMGYIVAAIYTLVGRNPLATQMFNSVLGASTAILIYVCAQKVFKNSRVAKIAAYFIAAFPSLILWSSQGLKDGIICFLLALAMMAVISLQKEFSYKNVIFLIVALGGIYTLRFYIFFAFIVAVFGSFFLGNQKQGASIGRQIAILVVVALGLTYLGALGNIQTNVEIYGNLEQLQRSRLDQAKSAESGFGEDIDISTTEGALGAIPIGLTYLMLAPFPWQMANLRQAITLPESIIWWGSIPFLIMGIWYTLKNKLRDSIAIILLTLLLTFAYSIFSGNVGTAYRMRAQMQIFYFIFVAVGFVLWQEKRENRTLNKKSLNRNNVVQQQALARRQSII